MPIASEAEPDDVAGGDRARLLRLVAEGRIGSTASLRNGARSAGVDLSAARRVRCPKTPGRRIWRANWSCWSVTATRLRRRPESLAVVVAGSVLAGELDGPMLPERDRAVRAALVDCGLSVAAAARRLRVSRQTLCCELPATGCCDRWPSTAPAGSRKDSPGQRRTHPQ